MTPSRRGSLGSGRRSSVASRGVRWANACARPLTLAEGHRVVDTVLVAPPADLQEVAPRVLEIHRLTERALERIRSDAKSREDLARLSEQERKILELIGEGCTNRQIGDALFLAEKTVKNYVTSILAKLGMQRRTEAAAYSARLTARRDLRS